MAKYDKQRLFEMMGKVDPTFKPRLNENAFNDAGEPLMTHNQYRDYSEPSEPEYDDSRGDYEREQTTDDVVKAVEKHFNTILETFDDGDHYFLTRDFGDIVLRINRQMISGIIYDSSRNIDKKFEEEHVEDLNLDELIQFFEPYRQYILSGQDAENEMANIQKQNAADAQYARQERAAMGGG